MLFRKEWPFPNERISIYQPPMENCPLPWFQEGRSKIDHVTTAQMIWVQWTSRFQLLCLSPSPRLGRWKSKTLGWHFDQQLGSLAHEIQMVSECVRDGIHHITSIFTLYIIYTSYIISYIYIHHIHHMAILHQLGWQEFINQFLNMFAHVLKLSNHEYMDGGIALPTLSQANSRNIQSSHIVRFTWKISSNHHKSSPMILKIGSQISNRYPTDIQSSSDRGRLPLPLRHRALWQGALGTGADGPGGGAPGHARQVPWLQWRRQKPWGKIDGELVENRDKSMETWKKMTDRRKNHVKLTEKGHSGFNCYLWMMFSCWK